VWLGMGRLCSFIQAVDGKLLKKDRRKILLGFVISAKIMGSKIKKIEEKFARFCDFS
jgi:hypothetical protein